VHPQVRSLAVARISVVVVDRHRTRQVAIACEEPTTSPSNRPDETAT